MEMAQKLVDFGLSEKEAKVYLALLELGPSSVTEVARRARVTRTNSYHLLNSLLAYGLVSSNEGESKVIFSAERPHRLQYLLKERMGEAERRFTEVKELMPELNSLYHDPGQKIRVRYYEGVEGIIAAYEDTLTSKGKIFGYASVEHQHSFFPGYFPEYYERRTQKGIKVECFLAEDEDSLRIKSLDKKQLRTTRIVPKSFAISPEINIYDNKVAILSLKERFGVIIESGAVTDAFRKMFVLAYERAGEYDKKISARLRKGRKG
ncbi:MAG: helix-turn-helix domain-containing protein [Candidatus Peregrinibacteria bacterium]